MICASWHLFVTHSHRHVCCALFKGTSTLNMNCTWSPACTWSFLPPLITPSHLSEADPQWQLQRRECPIPWPRGAAFRPPGRDSVSVRAAQISTVWQSSILPEYATWTDSCSFSLCGISSILLEFVWQCSGNSICVFPLLWQLWGVYKNGLLTVNFFKNIKTFDPTGSHSTEKTVGFWPCHFMVGEVEMEVRRSEKNP